MCPVPIRAAYAQSEADTWGRVHPEDEHPYRSIYQRDRDRVIHCGAFRRLEYKTQVFVNHKGDYYRTRLTHTLEVAQIARTIARALGLNEDLTEVVALGHDLGHPPFGHAGETALADLMRPHGGFEHNLQTLRIVTELERPEPDYPGLNLCRETLAALDKHGRGLERAGARQNLLEAQIVDQADAIAYDSHDLDDGLKAGLLRITEMPGLKLWDWAAGEVRAAHGQIPEKQFIAQAKKKIIGLEATDLIETTRAQLEAAGPRSAREALESERPLVGFSERVRAWKAEMHSFLYERVYREHQVMGMYQKARRFLRALFEGYLEDPRQLPPDFRARCEVHGRERTVCDYLAGMTDRYAQDDYARLFLPYSRA